MAITRDYVNSILWSITQMAENPEENKSIHRKWWDTSYQRGHSIWTNCDIYHISCKGPRDIYCDIQSIYHTVTIKGRSPVKWTKVSQQNMHRHNITCSIPPGNNNLVWNNYCMRYCFYIYPPPYDVFVHGHPFWAADLTIYHGLPLYHFHVLKFG